MHLLPLLAALYALSSPFVSALPKISRHGKYLYSEDGSRFYIKGISYQEQGAVTTDDPTGFAEAIDFVDPLSLPDACTRDAANLKTAGINAVRVYSVNATLNHDECMKTFEDAGIYVLLDLSTPSTGSIDRVSPAWSVNLLNGYIATIDAFSKYTNVLSYGIGNEIITGPEYTPSAAIIKAAVRDIKAYLKSKNSSVLVSYASTDGDPSWRLALADYLTCGSEDLSLDIYGLNVYRWCGNDNMGSYNVLLTDYQDFPVPAFFSEFGCIREPPRLWTEAAALFGAEMSAVFSGGLAFSYFPTVEGYGMSTLSDNGQLTLNDDWNRLVTQYTQVSFVNSPSLSDAGSNNVATCPSTSTSFTASSTLPGTPRSDICDCFKSTTFSCAYSQSDAPERAPVLGELLNYACSQLGTMGGTCDPIGSNGATGVYGPLSVCDPATKLSYALTEYYELSNRNTAACNFGGNATVPATAPASSSAVDAAASACISNAPSGTAVPSGTASAAAGTSTSGGNGGNGGSSGGNSNGNGAIGGIDKAYVVALMTGLVGAAMGAVLM